MGMRLYLLSCGELGVPQTVLTPGRGADRRARIPIPAYLIQVDGQAILFDTGMPDRCYTGDPQALARTGSAEPPTLVPFGTQRDSVSGQLATLGLRPADVTLVVNSHLDFDHCGGNAHFAHCPLMLQAAEMEAARTRRDLYETDGGWDAPEMRYQTIQGDYPLASGAELLATPGHTPGHQSLLVRLPASGPMLFTFDAVYTAALWQADELGRGAEPEQARASMDRLRRVAAETGAQVVFGHDPEQWASLRHAPDFYA